MVRETGKTHELERWEKLRNAAYSAADSAADSAAYAAYAAYVADSAAYAAYAADAKNSALQKFWIAASEKLLELLSSAV